MKSHKVTFFTNSNNLFITICQLEVTTSIDKIYSIIGSHYKNQNFELPYKVCQVNTESISHVKSVFLNKFAENVLFDNAFKKNVV